MDGEELPEPPSADFVLQMLRRPCDSLRHGVERGRVGELKAVAAPSRVSARGKKHPRSVSPWPPLPPENGAAPPRVRRETPDQTKPFAGQVSAATKPPPSLPTIWARNRYRRFAATSAPPP